MKFTNLPAYVVLILSLCSCSGQKTTNILNNSNNNYQKAKIASDERRYLEAADIYLDLYKKEPNNLEFLYEVAKNMQYAEKYSLAINLYQSLLDRINNSHKMYPDVRENMAISYLKSGDYGMAESLFFEVVKIDASRIKTLNGIAIINSLRGDIENALEYFEMAKKIDNKDPLILTNQALCYAYIGQYKKALELSNMAVNLVNSTKLKNNHEISKRKIDLNHALILGLSDNLNESKKFMEPYLTQDEILNNLAYYSMSNHKKDLAISLLIEALSMNKNNKKAENNLEIIEGLKF